MASDDIDLMGLTWWRWHVSQGLSLVFGPTRFSSRTTTFRLLYGGPYRCGCWTQCEVPRLCWRLSDVRSLSASQHSVYHFSSCSLQLGYFCLLNVNCRSYVKFVNDVTIHWLLACLFVQKLPDKFVKLFCKHYSTKAKAEVGHAVHVCERFKVWPTIYCLLFILVYSDLLVAVCSKWRDTNPCSHLFIHLHLFVVN